MMHALRGNVDGSSSRMECCTTTRTKRIVTPRTLSTQARLCSVAARTVPNGLSISSWTPTSPVGTFTWQQNPTRRVSAGSKDCKKPLWSRAFLACFRKKASRVEAGSLVTSSSAIDTLCTSRVKATAARKGPSSLTNSPTSSHPSTKRRGSRSSPRAQSGRQACTSSAPAAMQKPRSGSTRSAALPRVKRPCSGTTHPMTSPSRPTLTTAKPLQTILTPEDPTALQTLGVAGTTTAVVDSTTARAASSSAGSSTDQPPSRCLCQHHTSTPPRQMN
mmetsp:Transcript_20251/g.60470  ORF Transcript_20251/g.60470 Transcript_20251/m.60470 type:complete len:275 (+) Transcript_20251:387-1211(+)